MQKKWIWCLILSTFYFFIGCRVVSTNTQIPQTIDRVEQTIPIEPLPDFLGGVTPEPGSTYTLSEYQSLALSPGWNARRPGVCFHIWALADFMEPGDIFSTAGSWLERVHLTIDDERFDHYDDLTKTNSSERFLPDPDTGEIIWQGPPGSPFTPCYAVQLNVGYHIGIVTVEKTSGEQITYTWPFTITE